MVSARPPPLFSSPAAARLLPPCPAQSACRLLRLSNSAVAPLVRFGRRLPLADRWAHPVSELGVVTFIGQHPSCHRPTLHHLWSILDHQNLTHNLAAMSSPISPLPPSIPALTREINPLESASIAINAITITTAIEPLPWPYKRSLTSLVHSTPLH
jgi:hypothetical protein